MRKVSLKRAKQNREYSKLRIDFLLKNNLCQVCTWNEASDVHHTYAGANRTLHYLDVSTWMAVCRNCHQWVHNNPKKSKELGYLC